jgi:hypothetical protein
MFTNFSATELLFDYLVQRYDGPMSDKTTKILVPDTLIYKCSQPYYWYYTTSNGQINRESKKKIAYKTIQEEYLSGRGPTDICCTHYIYDYGAVTEEKKQVKKSGGGVAKPSQTPGGLSSKMGGRVIGG